MYLRNLRRLGALLCLLLAARMSPAAGNPDAAYGTSYENLKAELLLENARVRVERFTLAPGAASGGHSHRGDALMVVIRGGVLSAAPAGRSVLWKPGRVAWLDAHTPPDPGVRNTGDTPVELIWVAFKPAAPGAARAAGGAGGAGAAEDFHLNYPNIPGEDLLENEQIVVQRFLVQPGQWEGVHAHRPNMLYIHVKGGHWSTHTYKVPEHAYDPSPDGEVGWMDPFDLAEGHESRNIGTEPIDLIWVTLKH